MEYAGELLPAAEGSKREQAMEDDSVYRYFFHHDNKEYWLVRCFNEVAILTDKRFTYVIVQ